MRRSETISIPPRVFASTSDWRRCYGGGQLLARAGLAGPLPSLPQVVVGGGGGHGGGGGVGVAGGGGGVIVGGYVIVGVGGVQVYDRIRCGTSTHATICNPS